MMNSGEFDGTPVAGAADKVMPGWRKPAGPRPGQLPAARLAHLPPAHVGHAHSDVYCDACGTVPVPYDQLPVCLPEKTEFQPSGENALLHTPAFLNTECPKCGREAKRETDTMDTFMCSSWYQYAYVAPTGATASP